jgi:hypothetical protein
MLANPIPPKRESTISYLKNPINPQLRAPITTRTYASCRRPFMLSPPSMNLITVRQMYLLMSITNVSGIRESNPSLLLGKQLLNRSTNPATVQLYKKYLVGGRGFEPPTSRSQTVRSSQLS